ncbi:hypothetical protein GOHSU_28_00310 [Gordonia hirsuta DSM 44140 = NBRC 16056]|uniref:Interferon-induced transmembrane protein n=1 Tax=Gordonia hirsuta DSM 44140 = NBRC 16056 TaxID=1121927 RepID=L7LB89_9ACTN|nr:CD225/dispanin family protein [Gordonia hirsuta]GAC57976.1 hypothetical protein GOHSU_28_00310 [Gordonia hirsuta DSM 44140 = NBRC 16056]
MTGPNEDPQDRDPQIPDGGIPDPQIPGAPYGQQPQYGGAPQYGQQPYGGAPQYGAPQYGGAPLAAPPANSMTSSILVTVASFILGCGSCLPFIAGIVGIVAIVKASQVNKMWAMGDQIGAQTSAADAAKYSKIAWIVLGVAVALAVVSFIILAATGNLHVYTDTYNFSS